MKHSEGDHPSPLCLHNNQSTQKARAWSSKIGGGGGGDACVNGMFFALRNHLGCVELDEWELTICWTVNKINVSNMVLR